MDIKVLEPRPVPCAARPGADHATKPACRRWLATAAGSAGSLWMADDGYKHMGSVVNGFEDAMRQCGRRGVRGWKNAGPPWRETLERERRDFPQ